LVVDEVLAVGDADFQRKCLGKMGDVAQQGRTVLFVSHNMSAILRLTEEAIVLNKGQLLMRGPTQQAVDFYLSSGQAQAGERIWDADEVPPNAAPFRPIAMRLKDQKGRVIDTVRSIEPVTVELEYCIDSPLTGLRVGFYLSTMRGEYIITSFDVDEGEQYEKFGSRSNGHYVSRAILPADLFNEGRYMLGMNASSFGVRRYFMDENALAFNVDISGAPGTQWAEPRQGPIRPRLDWKIEKMD
jgi:lipopolysaccharide transport system ATP-binding protein